MSPEEIEKISGELVEQLAEAEADPTPEAKTKAGVIIAKIWEFVKKLSRGEIRELIVQKLMEILAKLTLLEARVKSEEEKLKKIVDVIESVKDKKD
jgi:hypothetical protein